MESNGLTDWIEIFRIGKQTDSKGVERTFGEADLFQIVDNFRYCAPVPHVITHQELYSPFAYAQIVDLKVENGVLLAKSANIEPQFEKLVADGRLYSRSVRLIPTEKGWKLTHLAWLGAEPPAVEGLAPVQFSASATAVDFSFSSTTCKPEDSTVSDKNGSGGAAGFTQADIDAAREAGKQSAAADFAAREAALKAELKVERDAKARAEWQARIDAACADGRLTPAQAEGMAEFALQLPEGAIEFSRGDGSNNTVKTDVRQWFIDFMSRLPKQVAMTKDIGSDTDTGMDAGDADAIARAAMEYQAAMQAKGIMIGASAAVAHVTGGKA